MMTFGVPLLSYHCRRNTCGDHPVVWRGSERTELDLTHVAQIPNRVSAAKLHALS